MIAEIIPEAYDAVGRKVMRPDLRSRGIHPTLPMGRYLGQPLSIRCETIEEVRKFLATCQGVSDRKLFGKEDYWQPPEDFERLRKGDCEDFSLWTWRQFLAMGYDARIVFGRHGRYGIGHAWVSFLRDGKCFLVEPQFRRVGETFPRLSTLQYHPKLSVAWDGSRISFFSHQDGKLPLRFRRLVPLVGEWLYVWGLYSGWVLMRLPRALCRTLAHKLSGRST
jgi:hypothetical protein